MKESFEEKELKILRNAIDNATFIIGKKLVQSDSIKNIIEILETFMRTHKILCYGGTAINNILPEQYRFYNKNIEIPDYDFFSPYATEYAKELANIYYKAGYEEVEAKSGVHSGTYKVFVNFVPIADITLLDKKLFQTVSKKAIKVNGINYCPPNFLRMAMYVELSRPMGDVSRWEKVLKRIILLNKNYPLKGISCNEQDFQRHYEGTLEDQNKIYEITRTSFINQGVVFFGGYAAALYSKYMPYKERKQVSNIPDFDVLSENPESCATILKEQLHYEGYKEVKIFKKNPIGGYIDVHYEIIVNNDVIAFIYKPLACHSYNLININGQKIKVATIDTILSFYLIFIYANRPYYDENRLLCIAEYLFKVQLKNRLQQKGLLRRFSVLCYGKQKTLEDMREEKAKLYAQIRTKEISRNSKLYNLNFFRYIPKEKYEEKYEEKNKSKKNTRKRIAHTKKKKYKTY
uniref:Poly(A) polymerase catalytic subunit domain-containing protein n=1 Tax=viral metagenome TaxID=1070528 RepID=A0A6C0H490_9ZZZZ